MVRLSKRQQVLLAQCASEPIHRLGRTQRFGVLLAFDPRDRRVAACSENAPDWLGRPVADLLGARIDALLPASSVDAACAHASVAADRDGTQHLHRVAWPGRAEAVDVSIHQSGELVVIEAEPDGHAPPGAGAAIEIGMRDLAAARQVPELAESAVRAVAGVTGYSRVMLYRFAADGSGTVIAERLAGQRPHYAGLRYPAGDIPEQARALYLRNPTRVIVDVQDEGLPLCSLSAEPLDLSLSVLRSVSPVHLHYLRNMGTAASMSISLVVDGQLWGLIACHHHEPVRPSLACRGMAELLGRLYGLAFARAVRSGLDGDIKALLLTAPGVEPLADASVSPQRLDAACESIARLFEVSGVVARIDGHTRSWGLVPPPEEVGALAAAAARLPAAKVMAVESLATLAPGLARFSPQVAGMVALPLSAQPRDWLLLLRDEVRSHVRWAGDPSRSVSQRAGRLCPRSSFEAWEEAVRGHCEPWTRTEIELADVLRLRLLETLLAQREQRELDSARRAAQQQSLLVRELNHRVRNMLGLIQGLVHQTALGAATVEDFSERLHDRVHALSRAYTQIERGSWQPRPLRALIEEETEAFAEPGQVRAEGEAVSLAPGAFLSFALVLHELATNARKYGALSVPQGRLDVRWHVGHEGGLTIDWREFGGPRITPPRHSGFGTRVIRQALSHQLHGRATLDFRPEGLHAELSAPRGFSVGTVPAAAAPAAPPPPPPGTAPRRMLVVEDDLVIALLAEALLGQMGCTQVVLAGSRDEALQALDAGPFDAALLDVHLGDHTSEAVAERLAGLGVPAVLATGYSESDPLPEALRRLPRVSKPYGRADLERALAQVA